jgi:hypothetical protein
MKKDLDGITKLNPDVRYSRLKSFLEKITKTPEAQKDLANWEMEFSSEVVKVNALVLVPITVIFNNVIHIKEFF